MPLLTVRAIDAHKPKAEPYKLTLDRGLQLRIAPDGARTLLVRYTVKGRPESASIGSRSTTARVRVRSGSQLPVPRRRASEQLRGTASTGPLKRKLVCWPKRPHAKRRSAGMV